MTDYIVISPEYFKPRRAPSGLAKAIRQTCEATRYKRAGMARHLPSVLSFGVVTGRKNTEYILLSHLKIVFFHSKTRRRP